jgi:hydrogenase maturation protein HypF
MEQRLAIKVSGIVQGVGFRPFIYRLANRFQLGGRVYNNSNGVEIEIQGNADRIAEFIKTLSEQPPPLALITEIQTSELAVSEQSGFKIIASFSEPQKNTLISPDIATCQDCRQELLDPHNRRYFYPFINCTNCGPRYTIITDIPYDRPKTSMANFEMCARCRGEYEDPAHRRFHAQPNACPDCGPRLRLLDREGNIFDPQPISKTVDLLHGGAIIAIKGIGGFHLAVDAKNNQAVQRLRERKHRFEKPLALMVRDIQTAEQLVELSPAQQSLLASLQRPIVLCRKREKAGISSLISLDNNYLGLMLPYSPLHEILFALGKFDALVMTSANMSEEPICYQNEECLQLLPEVADYFLEHNRDIYIRCDDSVMRIGNNKPLFIRRSRGYAPRPILLKNKGRSVLAVGGHLKNTICLTKDNLAFISQHIGDLENVTTLQVFEQTIQHLQKLMEIEPQHIIHDLHPDYLSTKWVQENARIPFSGLQHHYAHILSVMAECGLEQPVIGLALDGAGYGPDGTIWGGEVLLCDLHEFQRYGHFENVPMPGGEQAILQPWRMAAAYLKQYCTESGKLIRQFFPHQGQQLDLLDQMLIKKINSPLTSSCGRLFDAVAALLGLKNTVAYEGQAAIILEAQCEKPAYRLPAVRHGQVEVKAKDTLDIGEILIKKMDGCYLLSAEEIIPKIVKYKLQNRNVALLSNAFHNRLIAGLVKIIIQAQKETDINIVALSGGCFQNMILLENLVQHLQAQGLIVYYNTQVPANDGGISLGQAYWGMHNS